jgi:hypothetical protein
MQDKSIQIINDAIKEGWKRIHLQNLGLCEVPELLATIDDLELVDLRGNNLEKIPEWLNLYPDFETSFDIGLPKSKTVYLHGNRIISLSESVVAIIRSQKVHTGLFEMILSHFDSIIQQIDYSFEIEDQILNKDGSTTIQRQLNKEKFPNQWDNNVILQNGNSLVKLTKKLDKPEIQIVVGGVDGAELNCILSRLFEYVNSIDSNQGTILQPCPSQNCQKQCVQKYIFDFKYLEGFHKKYLPKIQCYESGRHVRLDNFSGLTQPVVQIFIEYAIKDSKYFEELCRQFPKKGWDYDTDIRHQGIIEPGALTESECEANFRSSKVVIFLLSVNLINDKKSYVLLKDTKKRWQFDDILFIPIEIGPCFWRDGIKDFEEDKLPNSVNLIENNWHDVAAQIHGDIERWIKNRVTG